jgi:hypothetical protein
VSTPAWLASAALLVCAGAAAQSQQAVREQLLGRADAAKQTADALDARVLAPETYAAGLDVYVAANERLDRGRDLDRVREDAAEAQGHFERAAEAAKLARATLSAALTARAAAEHAGAARYDERDWSRAEAALMEAARALEDGNLKKASREAGDVAERYREAESKALLAKARGR